jgi:Ran GTPase-activating protein (RanGAP) involved in mRNA processing and transport
LDLHLNELRDEGAQYLCEELMDESSKLIKLDISRNGMTSLGAMFIAEGLVNSNLIDLKLCNNRFGDEGIAYLCEAFKDEKCKIKLDRLDFTHTEMGDEGVKHLSSVCQYIVK